MQMFPVALDGCTNYDIETIEKILKQQLISAGVSEEMLSEKRWC